MNCAIIGAGTYGEVYLAYLRESGVNVVAFFDVDESLWGTKVQGVPVLGDESLLKEDEYKQQIQGVYCPIGNNPLRVKILTEMSLLGYETPVFIHPTAVIHPEANLGSKGVYVLPGTVISPYTVVEDYCMFGNNVNVEHHSLIEAGVFMASGVSFGANLCARRYVYIGMGATVMTGVKELGENCLIGAGSMVIKDVPEKAVVAGNPARILRYK